jgi:hypothetical protein
MNDERAPFNGSQEPGLNSEDTHVQHGHDFTSTMLKIAVVLFVILAGMAVGYGWLQHDIARQMAAERAQLQASLAEEKSEADAMAAKVNLLTAAQATSAASPAPTEPIKNEQFLPRTHEVHRHSKHVLNAAPAPVEDPRWEQFQQQLGNQQKQLEDNQKLIADTQANLDQAKTDMEGNLQSARTELGGDIARNHDELVALEKKGERNYYEFSFEKSATYHHTGPISIALHKADNKHEYCDLQLLVDDKAITKKHVNLYESVTFYPEGYHQPLELVINRIDKDSVHGYLSEPKFRPTEKAATPATTSTAASVTSTEPTAPQVKLEHREGIAQ